MSCAKPLDDIAPFLHFLLAPAEAQRCVSAAPVGACQDKLLTLFVEPGDLVALDPDTCHQPGLTKDEGIDIILQGSRCM